MSTSGSQCRSGADTPRATTLPRKVGAVKTQVTYKGTEATPELASRVEAVTARVSEAVPGALMAKYVVEETPRAHSIGLVVSLAEGETWVRHAEGSDWDRAFLEIERRVDRLGEDD